MTGLFFVQCSSPQMVQENYKKIEDLNKKVDKIYNIYFSNSETCFFICLLLFFFLALKFKYL